MIAIEFETQSHNGIVEIPQQYQAWRNKAVRVILLDPEEASMAISPVSLKAVALNTKNYHFNRDDANER